MRIIVFCCANLASSSGSNIRARLIAEGLNSNGVQVCVVASGVPSQFATLGISHYVPGTRDSWLTLLSAAAENFHPDLIYGITEAAADVVVAVGKSFACPVAFDLHGLGFIEVLELGGGHGPRFERVKNSLRWLSKIPSAAAVTVANPRLFPVLRPFNNRTLPVFGITDVTRFTPEGPETRFGRDTRRIQVLYAGNFYKWQGVELLIDAIKRLERSGNYFEFTFLGSLGKDLVSGDRWRAELPHDSIRFIDTIDYDHVASFYRSADVLIIPRPFMLSTYLAFPQKLVDYMASGRTVIATDIAPHRWAIKDLQTGLLCRPSAEGIYQALCQATETGLRQSLGSAARRFAEENFCHDRQSKRIISLFTEILEDKRAA